METMITEVMEICKVFHNMPKSSITVLKFCLEGEYKSMINLNTAIDPRQHLPYLLILHDPKWRIKVGALAKWKVFRLLLRAYNGT